MQKIPALLTIFIAASLILVLVVTLYRPHGISPTIPSQISKPSIRMMHDLPSDMSEQELITFVRSHQAEYASDDPTINHQIAQALQALSASRSPELVPLLVDALGFISNESFLRKPPASVHDFATAVQYASAKGAWDLDELQPAYAMLKKRAGPELITPILDEIVRVQPSSYDGVMARAAEILALCAPVEQVQEQIKAHLDGSTGSQGVENLTKTYEQLNHLRPVAAKQ